MTVTLPKGTPPLFPSPIPPAALVTPPDFSSPVLKPAGTPLPFPTFGRTTPQTPQSEIATPIPRGFYVLAEGDFAPGQLRRIQLAYRNAGSPAAFSPLQSPASAASPAALTERGRLTPLGIGSSHPLRYRGPNNDAVFKAYQLEPGALRNPMEKEDFFKQIPGCPPGMGAYIDFVCTMYIRNLLKNFWPQEEDRPIIPRAAYVQIGDPSLRLTQRKPQSSSVRGTGLFSEFVEMHSFSSTDTDELNRIKPSQLEFMAAVDIALGNPDRNLTNLGYDEKGNVVIYDQALCLSEEALAGGKFCWSKCNSLKGAPSDRIVDFINRMDPYALGALDRAISDEIEMNLEKLPPAQQKGESRSLGQSRILPHQIAVVFMQKAIANGWSLSQIAVTLYSKNAAQTNLLHAFYKDVVKSSQDQAFVPMIHQVCDGYFASQKSSSPQSD